MTATRTEPFTDPATAPATTGDITAVKRHVLDTARTLTAGGDRDKAWGNSTDTHARVGAMWGAILDIGPLPPSTVAAMMIALKLVRSTTSPGDLDSWVDMAGYAGIGAAAVPGVQVPAPRGS